MTVDLAQHRTLLRVLWTAWLICVLAGSLASGKEISSLDRVLPFLEYDKLLHFAAYAGLAVLSILAFERRRAILVALSSILLGAVIELAQHFSPGRTPDVTDAIANTLGVFSGIGLGLLLAARLRPDGNRPRASELPTRLTVAEAGVQVPAAERD